MHENPVRPEARGRDQSVDVIRGAVMALMVLDHVRVYAAVTSRGTTAELFLTRWVTHFCAPTFLFLCGVSIFLASSRHARPAQARRLLVRGVGLVVLELTLIRAAWTFNLGWDETLFAGVIWSIGWCMVLMSGLIFLRRGWLAVIAAALVFGHDFAAELGSMGNPWIEDYPWFLRVLYTGGVIELGEGGPYLLVLYSIVPWIGVMAAGYLFGPILALLSARRRRLCIAIGATMIVLFFGLRTGNVYGDPRPWSASAEGASWVSFLNVTKYPASLSFVLMTLGPVILLLSRRGDSKRRVGAFFAQLGRVPLFFYLLHIPLVHAVAVLLSLVRSREATAWLFGDHPLSLQPVPDGYRYGLPLLYAVTVGCIAILYYACRSYESRRPRSIQATQLRGD